MEEENVQARIDALKKEKDNMLYLAGGLTFDHQAETRLALLQKADNIQQRINELELLLNKND